MGEAHKSRGSIASIGLKGWRPDELKGAQVNNKHRGSIGLRRWQVDG